MYKYLNKNPRNLITGDCAIRACALLTDKSWEDTYIDISRKGLTLCRVQTDNGVWGSYLRDNGFVRGGVENTCPTCYTVRDFAFDHPKGVYALGLNGHVTSLVDGTYFDTWDCGDETVLYFWKER